MSTARGTPQNVSDSLDASIAGEHLRNTAGGRCFCLASRVPADGTWTAVNSGPADTSDMRLSLSGRARAVGDAREGLSWDALKPKLSASGVMNPSESQLVFTICAQRCEFVAGTRCSIANDFGDAC